MSEAPSEDDLDFTRHFSPETVIPEPVLSAEELRRIDDLGVIGEATLKERGFYTRATDGHRRESAEASADFTVLVVEDDDGTAAVILKVLATAGYHTRRAANLAEIVGALSRPPRPDLILLDVMLPDANGFEILKRVRQNPALSHIPVIMLTSLSERGDIARGLGLGADGYLTKPALPSILLDAVKSLHAA